MTEPEPLQPVNRTSRLWRGRKYVSFSGCDYFRLSSHPAILKAIQNGIDRYGLSVSASRITTGNHELYQRVEQAIARWFGAQAAVLVSSGYQAPSAAAQALAGRFSHVLLDEQAHAALLDAASILDCPILKFKHCDPDNFGLVLARCGRGARTIALTDGVFPMDGSVAPLKEYLKRLPADGAILVDDAHGAGLLGAHGRGTPEFAGVGKRQIIQCISFSKAFGVFGGAVLSSRELRNRIVSHSRIFLGSTPLPLPLVNGILTSLQILQRYLPFHRRLSMNLSFVRQSLPKAGLLLPESPVPIIPIYPKSTRQTLAIRRQLLASGIYPPFMKYPGAPEGGCYRFVISSEHTREQLKNLATALSRVH